MRVDFHGVEPILPPGDDPLLEALERAGLVVDEISLVGLSHLHYDHAGGLRHFAGRIPVHAQRDELAFGLSDKAEQHGIFRIDFDDPLIDWRLAATFIAGGICGAVLGGRLAHWLGQRRGALNTVFAVLIMLVAVYMLARNLLA